MFEEVNPSHPDELADRIAGALVDLAYKAQEIPKIAVDVLLGHGHCRIVVETSVGLDFHDVEEAVYRIVNPNIIIEYMEGAQDSHLAENQAAGHHGAAGCRNSKRSNLH